MLDSLSSHLRYALLVVLGVVVIILLSRWTGQRTVAAAACVPVDAQRALTDIATMSEAARVDTDPVSALATMTSAISALNTLRRIYGDLALNQTTGNSIIKIEAEMVAYQTVLMAHVKP